MGLVDFFNSLFGSKPKVSEPDATTDDINGIYEAISQVGDDGAFVVFMPLQPRDGEQDVLKLQFSIVSGKVGLDWLLLSPVNISERRSFLDLCEAHDVPVTEQEANGCRFLRVERGDLTAICKDVFFTLYPESFGTALDLHLIVEGFVWSKNA